MYELTCKYTTSNAGDSENKKMAKTDNAIVKWKKKKWYQLIAPKEYDSQVVGETLAIEKEELIGKKVAVNLMYLTKNPKKQNISVTFTITEVKDHNCSLKTSQFEIIPSSIKRLVRSGRDRIDDSFIVKSKDGVYARVKPLLITKSHQPQSIQTKIRMQATQFLREQAASMEFESFVKAIVEAKMQKSLRDVLNKAALMRNAEIRRIDLIENFASLKLSKKVKETIESVKAPEPQVEEVEAPQSTEQE